MRNRLLHSTIKEFAEQAAIQLAADAADGAEVPFELVESRGRRASLYAYRPLVGEYIRTRLNVLGRLSAYAPAARALEVLDGTPSYLSVRGEERVPASDRDRADAALRCFLTVLFEDTTDFELSSDRYERAYAELETALYANRATLTVIAPLAGLALESAEIVIGDGLSLVRPDTVSDPPDDLPRSEDAAVAVLTVDGDGADTPPLVVARRRFRSLLTALRLFDEGAFGAVGPAWARVDAGRWRLVPLRLPSAPPSEEVLVVDPEVEDELRGFVNLVARRTPRKGEVAWALRRFELGCERPRHLEGLSDYLLAARALLEPEGPQSGRLAGRLAVICATPARRAGLTERIAHAISLERAFVTGLEPAVSDTSALVSELAMHLRALLRDVLCGHLEPDLVTIAEGLLEPEPAAVPAPEAAPEPAPVRRAAPAATEPEQVVGYADLEPMPEPEQDLEAEQETGQLAAFT